MKTRRLYNSNDILLRLCLHIPFKKGYIPNQEYTILSSIDADIYVIRIFFIVLLFQEDHFQKIQPTCNVSSVYGQHSMLYSRLCYIA